MLWKWRHWFEETFCEICNQAKFPLLSYRQFANSTFFPYLSLLFIFGISLLHTLSLSLLSKIHPYFIHPSSVTALFWSASWWIQSLFLIYWAQGRRIDLIWDTSPSQGTMRTHTQTHPHSLTPRNNLA